MRAIEVTRAWARGELKIKDAHDEAFSSNAAARELTGAAKFAALAAGQAFAVAHVAAHQLGASAYAIRAAEAAAPVSGRAGWGPITDRPLLGVRQAIADGR